MEETTPTASAPMELTEMDISPNLRENYNVIWDLMDDKAYLEKEKHTAFSDWWYASDRTAFPNMPDHDQNHSFWHGDEWFSTDDYMLPEVHAMNEQNHEKVFITSIVKVFEDVLFLQPTGDVLKHFVGKDVQTLKSGTYFPKKR